MTRTMMVSAYNPLNTGMYSVDLAGVQMLRSLGRPWGLYRAHIRPRRPPLFVHGSRIRLMDVPERAQDFDTVLYWGDFQTNPIYGTYDFRTREGFAGRSKEPKAAFDAWMRFCLLKGVDMGARRVISVSNNMQALGKTLDDLGPEIRAEVAALYRRTFTAIYPRDPSSTEEVAALLPPDTAPRPEIACGVDAAFLLKDHLDRPRPPRALRDQRYFTYFFGRSSIAGAQALVRAVEAATGRRGVPLERWFTLNPRIARFQFSEMTTLIRHSDFLLSDTYHACVNALTMGRPVVGLGRPVSGQDSTIGDFKKSQLFGMFDLSDSYITFGPEDGDPGPAATEEIVTLARRFVGEDLRSDYFDTVVSRTEAYRSLLTARLTA